ncbi:MAG: hypothetical protein ACYDCK_11855 [Thermoplasmatota archaeon]
MGTKAHVPDKGKRPGEFVTGHKHDDETKALGPGVRPGTKSRILEARERAKKHANK